MPRATRWDRFDELGELRSRYTGRRRRRDDSAPQGGQEGGGHDHTDRRLTHPPRPGSAGTASAARPARGAPSRL